MSGIDRRKLRTQRPLRLVAVAAVLLMAMAPAARAIEEPRYTIVHREAAFEVRAYAPRVVAEVVVAGSVDDAGNQGFRLLAGYIFGKNQGERKMAMTAPVTTQPASEAQPTQVTPAAGPGSYKVQFMMPQAETLASLPKPVDERVMLRELPAERFAVARYSGNWSQANFDAHLAALRQALAQAGLATVGAPVFSRYNSPFALPFFRRNEIWLKLADPG